jgi:hypothetical protein
VLKAVSDSSKQCHRILAILFMLTASVKTVYIYCINDIFIYLFLKNRMDFCTKQTKGLSQRCKFSHFSHYFAITHTIIVSVLRLLREVCQEMNCMCQFAQCYCLSRCTRD